MSDEFKLEITPRSTRITIWNNVDKDFSKKFHDSFGKHSSNLSAPPLDMVDVGNEVSVDEEKKKETKFNNYKLRRKIRANTFKTLAYINFNAPNCYLLTLTFDERKSSKCKDLNYCHRCFKKYMYELRKLYDDLLYLGVFAKQKNENWHYHVLINLPENSTTELKEVRDLWKRGIAHTRTLYDWDDFSTRVDYCVKNMLDNPKEDAQGRNGYLRSHGLKDKVVLKSWNENEMDDAYRYLSDLISSEVDSEKPKHLYTISFEDDPEFSSFISQYMSKKGFPELFGNMKVARKILN